MSLDEEALLLCGDAEELPRRLIEVQDGLVEVGQVDYGDGHLIVDGTGWRGCRRKCDAFANDGRFALMRWLAGQNIVRFYGRLSCSTLIRARLIMSTGGK